MTTKIGFADELAVSSFQIMDFYKTHWKRKIALSDHAFHTWQFEDAVENRGANTCVVALKDGCLVGVMGLNKRIFNYGDKRLNGAELTTWVVDTELKGKGVGAKILNFIINNFEVLFGMSISQDALPIYLRSGFHYLRYIPRYIHVIDAKKILEISEFANYAPKLVKNSLCDASNVMGEEISWKQQSHAPIVEGNHFARSLEDLIWRYDNHPYYKYKSFKTTSMDGDVGYIVLREEVTDDVRIMHVIDILGPASSFESTIKFIESYAQDNDFWAVDVYSTLAHLNKYFSSRKWLSAVDSMFINVPNLFHPLEVRNPATTSLIYWSKNSNVDFLDLSRLYLTKQDCDLDRPTMNFIGC